MRVAVVPSSVDESPLLLGNAGTRFRLRAIVDWYSIPAGLNSTRGSGFGFRPPRQVASVSLDPGRENERRAGLLEMYRTALSYLDSVRDSALEPLREELTALQQRLAAEQRSTKRSEPRH